MSGKRRFVRDAFKRGENMGLDFNGAIQEAVKEKAHQFQFQTPQGIAVAKVNHSDMKRCHCGHDKFDLQYHVTWGPAPGGVIGQPPMCFRVEVFVCAACGAELSPANPKVGDPKLEV